MNFVLKELEFKRDDKTADILQSSTPTLSLGCTEKIITALSALHEQDIFEVILRNEKVDGIRWKEILVKRTCANVGAAVGVPGSGEEYQSERYWGHRLTE